MFWKWLAVGLANAATQAPAQHKILSAPNLALGDLLGRLAELEEKVARLEEQVRLLRGGL